MFLRRRLTTPLTTRPATSHDRKVVVALTRREPYVHTHLDWQPPEDWLGQQPFHLASAGRRVVAALACPPDPPDTAWLRVFAVSDYISPEQAWKTLWPRVRAELDGQNVPLAAALSMDDWLLPLLELSGFQWTHDVIGLSRAAGPLPPAPAIPARLRPAHPDDLEAIVRLDEASFRPPWRLSRAAIKLALVQATSASVAERPGGEPVGGQLIGYQISAASRGLGHLARLAVHPAWRGAGLGKALTLDALRRLATTRAVTVNTQSDNAASTALYKALGFTPTGDHFPVFQLCLR